MKMISTQRKKNTSMKRTTAGFTLIELMMVVAVIAILATIAYPAYTDQMRKSRRAQAKADLVEYMQMAERHHTVQGSYTGFSLPVSQSPRAGTAFYTMDISSIQANAINITATPLGAQASDTCGTLQLNQTGKKLPESPAECW